MHFKFLIKVVSDYVRGVPVTEPGTLVNGKMFNCPLLFFLHLNRNKYVHFNFRRSTMTVDVSLMRTFARITSRYGRCTLRSPVIDITDSGVAYFVTLKM